MFSSVDSRTIDMIIDLILSHVELRAKLLLGHFSEKTENFAFLILLSMLFTIHLKPNLSLKLFISRIASFPSPSHRL